MAEWVEKGSIKGPPGEIPDVSDFLRDGDVSSAISGSAEKVASDKAVKDYVDAQVSAEATSRQEQDSSLQTQIGGKANVEHSHEMDDVTGLNDKISEIETSVSGKANATHTHTTAQVDGLDTKLSGIDDDIAAKADKVHKHVIADVTDLQTTLDGKAAKSHEHSADNITSGTLSIDRIPNIPDAKIDGMSATKLTGTVPQANLPSYVDDVIEAENYASLPPTGEAGKIYVDKETNKTYRWGGSAYVEISASLALGETSATAFRGDYGKVAYDHAQAKGSQFASGLYKVETNAEGHVVNATAVAKSDITALGIPAEDTDTTYTAGAGLTLSGTEFGIADDGIIGRYLDDNCVMERNIAVGAVTSDKIPALAITTPKLVDNAVTAMKMADDAVATRSIQDKAVTADKIADGVIPESVSYDVATSEADGLMSSEDKTALDNLKTNAVTTDASGYVQKSPFKFKNSDSSVEMNFTSKTETSLDLEFRTTTGTDVVTISADNLFGEASGGIAMGTGATFDMGEKSVNGIVDAVGEGADGTKLATDKAVKDAIAAIEIPDPLPAGGTDGQVLTKTADGEAWEDIPDYENATTEYDGLMSASDKSKLDGIAEGADKLPDGGTEGQVLTKTSDGEAWADVPQPDLTGVVKFKSTIDGDALAKVGEGGQDEFAPDLFVVPSDYDSSSGEYPTSFVAMGVGSNGSYLTLSGEGSRFSFDSKTIKAIASDISDGDPDSLATANAIKYYADSVGVPSGGTTGQVLTKTASGSEWQDAQTIDTPVPISQGGTGADNAADARANLGITFASDEDFKAYMGIS